MTQRLTGLIVGEHGRMRDCLQALLGSIPQIDQIFQADDLEHIRGILSQSNVNFMLIDSNMAQDQLLGLLENLKGQPKPIKSLVLVETPKQEKLVREAGADEVLLRGSSAVAFIEALCRVVPLESLRERIERCAGAESENPLSTNL